MTQLTVRELILEALDEAEILECAMTRFDVEHMLLTAMRLSGAQYSLVRKVYEDAYENLMAA